MRSFQRFTIFIILALFTSSCATPVALGAPISELIGAPVPEQQVTPVAQVEPEYYVAPPDATPTPTPFQPIPPTPAYLPTGTPAPTEPPPPPPPTVAPALPAENHQARGSLPQAPRQMNILLLGSDQRPWDVGFRTDTIVLVTLNVEKGTVNLTSFPRDLYLTIPGYGMNRINTAYTFGGYPLLAQTFQYNFGVVPDKYVLINFSSFKQVIESLGGLNVNVHEPVSDYRNGYYVTIPAGVTDMDADTVLWYVRTRKTTSDFARTRRQQEVLQAIFEKLLSLNAVKRIPELYNLYKQNVTTDISFTDIIPLLPMATKVTDSSHIHQFFIGPEQVYDSITPEGAMVLVPRSNEAILSVLRQALNSP